MRRQVLIVGAGFGGLVAARRLAGKDIHVLLVDRNNYHTFTPLLYQVATCALDPSEVAYPVRGIFRGDKNVTVLMGQVEAIDPVEQDARVRVGDEVQHLVWDYLVLAPGSQASYFGNDNFKEHAYELRSLEDAVALRNHILRQFEAAIWENDLDERAAMLTLVVVGGGPTGLETAGAVYELYNHVLRREFADANGLRARVVLVEAQAHLLDPYPDDLRRAAARQLESLGVELRLGSPVTSVEAGSVRLADGSIIPAKTLIWSAGVSASPLVAGIQGLELAPSGRVRVQPTMQATTYSGIFVIGDAAYLEENPGSALPMMIPPAMQQGRLAAENILALMQGRSLRPFLYKDRGIMATIGRSRAVAWLYNRLALSGKLAWIVWLVFHLLTLLGFRNRLVVLVNWIWNYLTYDRGVRIILK